MWTVGGWSLGRGWNGPLTLVPHLHRAQETPYWWWAQEITVCACTGWLRMGWMYDVGGRLGLCAHVLGIQCYTFLACSAFGCTKSPKWDTHTRAHDDREHCAQERKWSLTAWTRESHTQAKPWIHISMLLISETQYMRFQSILCVHTSCECAVSCLLALRGWCCGFIMRGLVCVVYAVLCACCGWCCVVFG